MAYRHILTLQDKKIFHPTALPGTLPANVPMTCLFFQPLSPPLAITLFTGLVKSLILCATDQRFHITTLELRIAF